MKTITMIFGFALLVTVRTHSQFYAPETEYHDPVQRVYPVEAARVLAWRQTLQKPVIAEIAYSVATRPDQSTEWELRFLDAKGSELKKAKLKYPRATLESGPDFYREVFRQLWKAGIVEGPLGSSQPKGEVISGYWSGSGKIGLGREESLIEATKLSGVSPSAVESTRLAPQFAGLLTHAALPSIAEKTTIDNVLAARGAVWLAVTEQLSAAKFDALWAPTLFLSHRSRAAGDLWQKEVPSGKSGKSSGEQFWDLLLRGGSTKEAYLFATDEAALPFGLPLLAHDVRVNESNDLLADLLPYLAGTKQKLARCHNLGPFMAMRTSVSGGRVLDGEWPYHSRRAWLSLIAELPKTAEESSLVSGPLTNAMKEVESLSPRREDDEMSVRGLRETTEMLKLAHREGVGPLKPCGVVTLGDALNYGWEMAGLQLGARAGFARWRWGVPELAEYIYKTATIDVEGWIPFFKNDSSVSIATYPESLLRLQMLEGMFHRVGFSRHPFGASLSRAEAARLWVKRCWLRPADFEWQARTLWDAELLPEISELIEQLKPAGPRAAVEIITYLNKLDTKYLKELPRGEELRYTMAEMLPHPTRLFFNAVFQRDFAVIAHPERGPVYEKLYWEHPDGNLDARVLRAYFVAYQYENAKRFYNQMRRNITDTVAFSSGPGKMLWMLGYLSNDVKLREQTLEDSLSGSASDMMMNIWEHAVRGDEAKLKEQVKEYVERYEYGKGKDSRGRRLLAFLPLLPALKDPDHPRRDQALRYFAKDPDWTVLRWVWIEKYKLPERDSIVFLGGKETDHLRRFLIAVVEKDQAQALNHLNAFYAGRTTPDELAVLAAYLYGKMHPYPPEPKIDVTPNNVRFTREAVLQKLGIK